MLNVTQFNHQFLFNHVKELNCHGGLYDFSITL